MKRTANQYLMILFVFLFSFITISCQKNQEIKSDSPKVSPESNTTTISEKALPEWELLNSSHTGTNPLLNNHINGACFDNRGRMVLFNGVRGNEMMLTLDGTDWSFHPIVVPTKSHRSYRKKMFGDSQGRVWVSYGKELYLYQDKKLKKMDFIEISEPEAEFKNMLEDKNGFVWFLLDDHLFYYDKGDFYQPPISENRNRTNFMFLDTLGYINIFDGFDMQHWDGQEFVKWSETDFSLDFNYAEVDEYFVDSQGRSWVRNDKGYFLKSDGKWTEVLPNAFYYKDKPSGQRPKLRRKIIKTILEDKHGNIWFSVSDRIVKFDGNDFEVMKLESHRERNTLRYSEIMLSHTGDIWVVSDEGLFQNDGEEWYSIASDGFPNSVSGVCEDVDGNIYVAIHKGIFNYANGGLHPFREFVIRNLRVMESDKEGNLYFAGQHSALKVFRKKDRNFHNENVSSIFAIAISDNEIVVGGIKGVYRLSENGCVKISDHPASSLVNYRGELLIGANYVLNSKIKLYPFCNDNTNMSMPSVAPHYTNFIKDMAVDLDENLWTITDEGISKFDGESWTIFANKPDGIIDEVFRPLGTFKKQYRHVDLPFPSGVVATSWNRYAIEVGVNGDIWFGYKNNIIHYDNEKFILVEPDIQIKSDVIDIDEMSDGSVWFTTTYEGILVYRKP